MVLLYKGTRQERYTRPRKYFKRKRWGAKRWDKVIAPSLTTSGTPNKTQKPGAYALAVLDPEKASPCIIPDLASYPTNAYSIRQSITIPSNATGVGGIKFDIQGYPRYYTESNLSSDAVLAYNPVSDFTSTAMVQDMYARHRVVGASLRLEHPGNDANNQGLVVGVSLARVDPAPNSLVNMQNTRTAVTNPVKSGIYVTYRPLDGACFDMFLTTDATTVQYGTLMIHWTGAAANQNMVVHATIHYEGINYVSEGEYNPGGQVYTNPGEFDQTITAIQGTSQVTPGQVYTSGQYSREAANLANSVQRGIENLEAIISSGTTLYKGYKTAEGLYKR